MPFRHFIIKTVVLILIFPVLASAQLREFDIAPVQSTRLPVFTQHPDKAAVIINSSLTNLRFESNLEIVAILGNASEGEYILIVDPVRQIISVRAPGFQQGRIPIALNAPRQVAYFKVEPKDRIITERGNLIVRTEPAGAMVSVDGIPGEFQSPYTFENLLAVTHSIRVRLDDYQIEERLVRVEANRPTVESIRLTPAVGFLLIQEPDLELFLKTSDDPQEFRVSYTPGQPLKRPIGAYTYRIAKRFHRPASDTVSVRPGLISEVVPRFQQDFATYRFSAMPQAVVQVQANPQNAPSATRPGEVFLQAGVHELTLNATGYATERIRVVARSGAVVDTSVTLVGLGDLNLSAGVTGARASLSSGQVLDLPARFTGLRAGRYTAVVSAPFHTPDSLSIDVVSFQETTRTVSLRPLFSTLRVRTNSPAIRLSANDNLAPQSTTNGVLFLEQGQREVLVQADGYAPVRLQIRSVAGASIDTTLNLLTLADAGDLARREALPKGFLQLSADVDAEIYVNGIREGRLQTTLTLIPGRYDVEFRHPLKIERFLVDVPSADVVVRQVYLKPEKSRAMMTAIFIPGGGHIYTKQSRGYVYLGAMAGALSYAWLQNADAGALLNEYDGYLEQYRSASSVAQAATYRQQLLQAREDANVAIRMSTYGLFAAAGVHVIQLLDLNFSRPKYGYRSSQSPVSLGLAPNRLRITYRLP